MITAGLEAYALFDACDQGEWVVVAVYEAMDNVVAELRNPRWIPIRDWLR